MGETTRRLAEHALCTTGERPELPQHLLDFLAVAVGGAGGAESTPAVLGGVRELAGAAGTTEASSVADEGADDDGLATVIPTGERLAPADAALANGTLAHSLDFDDTHLASSLHPAAPVIPAALAVAESTGASTGEFLDAVAAGYDVACTMGMLVNPDAHYGRGFHITATCGTFGATAAAAVVRGLTVAELVDAFGINGSQAAGSLQFLENGAWNKRLHPGLAARRAVEATALAAAGFRGAADPIEGEYGFLASYTDDPNFDALDRLEADAVAATGLKPYPCCRYLHAAIDGLLDIVEDHGDTFDSDEIDAVDVRIPAAGVRLTGDPIAAKRRPENFVDCQFSGPFAAALALTEGEAGAEPFLRGAGRLDAPPLFEDPAFQSVMDAVDVGTDESVQARFPDEWTARVVVEVAGERSERFVEAPLGEPEKPMSYGDTVSKARGLARVSDGRIDIDRLGEICCSPENHAIAEIIDAATWA
ncbi:MmgE/PrpD family protein [Halorubrum gandharaense]